jgi:aminomethyltransferase
MGHFVHFDRAGDFVGQEALRKIAEEGTKRLLVGVEIDGDPIAGNDALWALNYNGNKVGHVSRCIFSPRLERNIGWANVPVEMSEIGTSFTLLTPNDERVATVCETPWFKSFIGISEELKAEIRGNS